MLDALVDLRSDTAKSPDTDLLVQIGTLPDAYDELARSVKALAADCPEGCLARQVAEKTQSGLLALADEAVRLLAVNDMELVETVAEFDPSRHRPVGRVPRPEGARGDGEVKRRGLVLRRDEKERIVKPALVVIYEGPAPPGP